jgi:RimJ/RimL family protein N-acetyltransferase
MIAELVAHHGVTRLTAVLKRRNDRSRRLLERLGFSVTADAEHRRREAGDGELLMVREAPVP